MVGVVGAMHNVEVAKHLRADALIDKRRGATAPARGSSALKAGLVALVTGRGASAAWQARGGRLGLVALAVPGGVRERQIWINEQYGLPYTPDIAVICLVTEGDVAA